MRVFIASFARGVLPLLMVASSLGISSAKADEVTFDLQIARGHVPTNMRLIRVRQGDIVKLRWRTDQPTVLHLHGYDVESKVEPGSIAEMTFTARATGRFSVEEHKPRTSGGHTHGAAIVRIEVHPR